MTALNIIDIVKSSGVTLSVIDGQLKGKNLKALDSETLDQVKRHKAEIVQLLAPAKNKTIHQRKWRIDYSVQLPSKI